jgi:membrane-associated phospholipid phosphatase
VVGILQHPRRLWGPKWALPGGLPLLYVAAVAAVGDLRNEHLIVLGTALVLAYTNARTKRFFLDALPYLIVAIGYDMVRYARVVILRPEQVLGCSLRSFELALFRVAPGVTYQDWFAAHHTPLFDLLFAIPYLIFVYLVLGYAIFLYFVDRPRMRHFMWSYAVGNLLAFVLWLTLPAAPPWYLRVNGCAIDLAAAPSPAALTRVDALLGITYFEQFYSRAASVFGALPSMHCAFPVMGLLTAWRHTGWKTRPIHIFYTLLMATAAVYLDHHWVVDVIAGWVVAVVSVWIAGWGLRWIRETGAAADEADQRTSTLGARAGSEPSLEPCNPRILPCGAPGDRAA